MSEGTSDADDLFNLADICVAVVDGIMYSGDGSENGLVGGSVVCKGDGCLSSPEWCSNGGTRTWNGWYGGRHVFLVKVIELAGGRFIRMWEVLVSDVDEGGWHGVLYT